MGGNRLDDSANGRVRSDPQSSQKKFNAYGLEVRQALKAKGKRKDKNERTRAAFEHVAEVKSDPKDPDAPTFGKLLDQGKLPVEKISADTSWYDKKKGNRSRSNEQRRRSR